MVDKELASLSNQLMLGAVLLYVITMVGYAADLAFGRKRTAAAAVREPALVGAGPAADPAEPPEFPEAAVTTADSAAADRKSVV